VQRYLCLAYDRLGRGRGRETGRGAARLSYVDEDIVARAAAAGGLEPGEIADEERRKSYAGRLLDTLAQGGGDAWTLATTAAVEVVRPEDVRALIRETVAQTAGRGNVVIVAHAASHLLDPGPHMLRVFVTASPATRQKRVATAEQLDEARAGRTIRTRRRRRDYLSASTRSIQYRPTTTLSSAPISSRRSRRRRSCSTPPIGSARLCLRHWSREPRRWPPLAAAAAAPADSLREHLQAAVENDDVAEARRLLAGFEFSDDQRRNMEQLLDAWERGT
jgi:hypothetical protein